ncbi:MAG: M28 family peptidase [Vicingaceae bacterium]
MERSGILRISLFVFLLSFLFWSCDSEQKKKSPKPSTQQKAKKPTFTVERPPFSEDSAYAFIEQQLAFGPRVPNTEAHQKAARYLSSKLSNYGFAVSEQKAKVKAFDGEQLNIVNIIGEYKAELNNRVLLFAHWDTRPFADQDKKNKGKAIPGANDGGSGVGVLLEIARQLDTLKPSIGVDIIFFDAEDYGQPSSGMQKRQSGTWCLGSQYWAKNPHKANYSANYGILLDMVGAKDAYFTKEAISLYYAPQVVDHVWGIAKMLGHGNHFVFQETTHVGEDDHLYVNKIANIPSIDIIQYDPSTMAFAPHWHTHDDNIDIIDKATLEAVGETVLATVLKEAK